MMVKNLIYDTFITRTGSQIRVREIRQDDAPYLLEIFEHMSADSRYRRFHQSMENLSAERKWQEAERIAKTDPTRSGGIIAFADFPGEPNMAVAAARFVCTGNGTAEAAVSVIDTMQRQGMGTKLMDMLIELAQAAGVRHLVASVQNDNVGIWKILQRLPYVTTRVSQGSFSEIIVDLTQRRETAVVTPSATTS
ncbi:MAG: GNAT family N-acetyltransferase [Anaerolineales bacterium]|nr:GNAT family N-acetyltransferase [Anaerolineales bacterium]